MIRDYFDYDSEADGPALSIMRMRARGTFSA